ncbi:MAG: hypothetical protein HGA61_03860 [Candidatus Moranbacteria bacterium]|nr:hypothetical protein [Candidatus Moranbacteria bacterium]
MKKVFIISIVFLSVTLFVFGIYNLAFKQTNNNQEGAETIKQAVQTVETNTTSTKKNPDRIMAVSKEPVLGAVIDKKTEKIYFYSALNGTVWQADSDGFNLTQISDTKLSGIIEAAWSPDRSGVLTTFDKNGKKIFFSYDNLKKTATKLNEGIDMVSWDSLGTKIIYKYYDAKTKRRNLSVANTDGSNWRVLLDNLVFKKISISSVPLSAMVSFWNFPDSTEESVLQSVPLTGGETKKIFQGRFGGDYLWSPDGSSVLVSSSANKNSKTVMLGIIDSQGRYSDLNIPTVVSKCVWSIDNKTVYYALPGGIPEGAIMPNDYQSEKFTTQDTFWKIDVSNGSKERIVELSDIQGEYDLSKPFLSATEGALFFVNKVDEKLYKIDL